MGDYLYPIFLSIAAISGMWICERRSAQPRLARITYLAGLFGGIIGARLWFSLQYGQLLTSPGMSFYGFGLGALAGTASFHRWYHGRWASTDFPDAVAPAYALGTSLFRLGCYSAGCCFGKVCDLPWAVRYGKGSAAYAKQVAEGTLSPLAASSLPVHPTQLYDVVAGLLAFAVLMRFSGRKESPILRYEAWMGLVLSYAVYRFFLEFLRGDAGGRTFGPLTFSQATSIAIFVPVLSLLIYRRIRFYRTREMSSESGGPA